MKREKSEEKNPQKTLTRGEGCFDAGIRATAMLFRSCCVADAPEVSNKRLLTLRCLESKRGRTLYRGAKSKAYVGNNNVPPTTKKDKCILLFIL